MDSEILDETWIITFPNSTLKFCVSKNLLTSESSKFQEMIYSAERENNNSILLDDDTRVVDNALRYLAGLSVEKRMKTHVELLLFAVKYEIPRLLEGCKVFIMSNLNDKNVCYVYETLTSNNIHDGDIFYKCWRIFDYCWKSIFSQRAFLTCSPTVILTFVLREIYNNMKEEELFKALVKWGTYKTIMECSTTNTKVVRETISVYMSKIRFMSMSIQTLEKEIFPMGILYDEEIAAIRKAFRRRRLEGLPSTICQNLRNRKVLPNYRVLLEHVVQIISLDTNDKMVKNTDNFICSCTVKGQCFFRAFALPIENMSNESIVVNLYIFVDDKIYKYKIENLLVCDYNQICIKPPLFLHYDAIINGVVTISNISTTSKIVLTKGTPQIIPKNFLLHHVCLEGRYFLIDEILLYF
ncbi:uncharacterized protein LOC111628275 [Centruroides sculpturatus]|uniref:uncharacterized protein LOC111628275 n=1 Tax=Centruroides sculpturatus TaxID=218467 RepID=UPI000C6D7B0B|nr:uncharacterized protein LOC111628275 [Centruroides sculpturatus]